MAATKLCVFSYNSRGFSDLKQETLKNLTIISKDKIPVICNQENFLLKSNRYKINQALENFHVVFNPAVKNSHDTGRPKNGMFIAVPNVIKEQVRDISPGHWRIQAVIISTNQSRLLIINSYFPTDPRTVKFDDHELIEIFTIIDNIVDKNDFDNILLFGDINADFLRNSGHVQSVQRYLNERLLTKSWEQFDADFTHTYEDGNNVTHTSKIDHFFWNSGLDSMIEDAGVVHNIDNSSDHCPIYCVINCNVQENNDTASRYVLPRPSWKKASDEEKNNYLKVLREKLSQLSIPECVKNCKDIHCNSSDHIEDLDDYVGLFFDAIEISATEALPVPNSNCNRKKNFTGWNDECKEFKENAIFWHAVWNSYGRPVNTEEHQMMKRTRNLYHYQIRKCKKAEENVKKNKLLDA